MGSNSSTISASNSGAFHLRVPDNLGMSSSSTDRLTLKPQKSIPEVFLTRLLSTKGTLKKFIDDCFHTILSVNDSENCDFPPAIKWLFDIFDESTRTGYVDEDSGIIHSWKSNSLPLRFWVNLIKNPDFVFDIEKTPATDLNLSIIAQTLMSSCLHNDPILNKESPSHKLLYAKDIPVYKDWVDRYYADIKAMPVISDQDMNAMLAEESRLHANEFNLNSALHEL